MQPPTTRPAVSPLRNATQAVGLTGGASGFAVLAYEWLTGAGFGAVEAGLIVTAGSVGVAALAGVVGPICRDELHFAAQQGVRLPVWQRILLGVGSRLA